MMVNYRKIYDRLRRSFDGNDPFVAGGHAVRGGGRTRNKERVRNTPEWVNNDQFIRDLLLRVFPKLATDESQRQRAAIWMSVIHMFFRQGYTRLHVAMNLKCSVGSVHTLVRNIRRAAAGKEVGGGGRAVNKQRGQRPRGRPKKNSALLETSVDS